MFKCPLLNFTTNLKKIIKYLGFCLKLKISIIKELTDFFFDETSHGSQGGFRYLNFRFKPWDGFGLYFYPTLNPLNAKPLDGKGAATS